MNAILGFAQILEHENLNPDQRSMLDKISNAGESLLNIINDILDLSKIEAGQLRIDSQRFTVSEVFQRVDNLLRDLADNKKLMLEFKGATGVAATLMGDPLRLIQVLVNLASNAIKFTEVGRVEVNVTALSVAADAGSVDLRFEVRDSGIGITAEALPNLFQPFSQADDSITRRFGGTGLGLAICKRLIELMGGRIGATSQVGQGSTFWFEMPYQQVSVEVNAPVATQPDAGSSAMQPSLKGLRILAVDDNRTNLQLIDRALQRQGAAVTLAADGQQALNILRLHPQSYDVVLMDIQMPVMDGLTATREIRMDTGLAHLPVIALTAGVLDDEREAALKAGISDIIPKPINLKQLSSGLSRYARPGAAQ
jgi:CheY-like chemotaxis protein